jgi:hypothetical protein
VNGQGHTARTAHGDVRFIESRPMTATPGELGTPRTLRVQSGLPGSSAHRSPAGSPPSLADRSEVDRRSRFTKLWCHPVRHGSVVSRHDARAERQHFVGDAVQPWCSDDLGATETRKPANTLERGAQIPDAGANRHCRFAWSVGNRNAAELGTPGMLRSQSGVPRSSEQSAMSLRRRLCSPTSRR